MVRIQKDDTVIVGSGFSASGISGRYTFTGMVNGNIVTKSEKSDDDKTKTETSTETKKGDKE